MVQRLILLALLLCSLAASASDGSPHACEQAAESVLIVVRTALQTKTLTPDDIRFMVEEPDKIKSPFVLKKTDIYNLSYRRKLERALGQLKDENVSATREKLRALFESSVQNAEIVNEARLDMAPVLAPREVKIQIPRDFDQRHIYSLWHKDRDGELQRAIYNHQQHRLVITNRELKLDKDFSSITGRTADVFTAGKVAMLSLPHDGLVLAHVLWNGEHMLVFDKQSDKAFLHKLEYTPKGLKWLRDSENNVFLVVYSEDTLTIYALRDERLTHYYTFKSNGKIETQNIVILNSDNGHAFIGLKDLRNRVQIIDVWKRAAREYLTEKKIKNLIGTILPSGEFVCLVGVTDMLSSTPARMRFDVLRGSTSEIISTDYFPFRAITGSLFQTPQGKLYFPIVTNHAIEHTPGKHRVKVHLFDVLAPLSPLRLWDRLMKRPQTLKPIVTLEPTSSGITDQSPIWLSPTQERVLMAVPLRDMSAQNVLIFEPERQPEPIGTVPFSEFANNATFEMIEVPRIRQVLMRITDSSNGRTDVYDVEPGSTRIDSLRVESQPGLIADKHGDLYVFATSHSGPPSTRISRFHIFRLTVGGREAAE